MADSGDTPSSPAAIFDAHCRARRLAYPAAPDGTPVWPPSLFVPGSGEPVQWLISAGRGTVHSTTAIHARDEAPRNVALIDLDEGYRMMSRVEGSAGDVVPVGARVTVRFEDSEDADLAPLPVFVLDQRAGA